LPQLIGARDLLLHLSGFPSGAVEKKEREEGKVFSAYDPSPLTLKEGEGFPIIPIWVRFFPPDPVGLGVHK